ncbi:hypothetical protein [Dysgonomonas sp. 520]|nr:hypothetical protein [Dysgonomonas sp. 520]
MENKSKTIRIKKPSQRLIDLMKSIEKKKEETRKDLYAKMDTFFVESSK